MAEEKKKSSKMPEWMGKYPFPPDKKRPIVIRNENAVSLIYGLGDHLDSTPMYISTDKIYMGEYTIPPGEYFEPPDIHAGDECYYCLEGTATIFDPVHGDVVEMNPGDGLLIPKGTWHQGFNFGCQNFRVIAVIAPKAWSEEGEGSGISVEFKGKSKFYKAED
jgi:mannose-6-phosphate isomerase-like protein (cupin superfamily)